MTRVSRPHEGGAIAAPDAPPAVPTAYPGGAASPTFGLDRPMPLLGGASLGPDGLASIIGLDHVPAVLDFVAAVCRMQASRDRRWYSQPPLVLLGPPGVGRGTVVELVARAAGVPVFAADTTGFGRGEERTDAERQAPPIPILAMAATGCANPIVLVDLGARKPAAPAAAELAAMMDPHRSGRWFDAALGTVFDLSHVSWVIQTSAEALTPNVEAAADEHGAIAEVRYPIGAGEELRRLAAALLATGVPNGRGSRAAVGAAFDAACEAFPSAAQPTGRRILSAARSVASRGGATA